MQTGTIKRGRNTVLAAAWQSLSDEERGKYREGYAAKRQQAASLAESRVSARSLGTVQVIEMTARQQLCPCLMMRSTIDTVGAHVAHKAVMIKPVMRRKPLRNKLSPGHNIVP